MASMRDNTLPAILRAVLLQRQGQELRACPAHTQVTKAPTGRYAQQAPSREKEKKKTYL